MTTSQDVERARGEAKQSFAAFVADLACRVVIVSAAAWLVGLLAGAWMAGRLR